MILQIATWMRQTLATHVRRTKFGSYRLLLDYAAFSHGRSVGTSLVKSEPIDVARDQRRETGHRHEQEEQSGVSRRALLKSTGAGALMAAVGERIPVRRSRRAGGGPGSHQGQARLHRADRRGAAVRRQGEGHLRQVRHARRRGAEAGLVGRDARQPRARRRRQRHRRRAHPDADAVPDLGRQGDAEQRADADVHPGAAQSRTASASRSRRNTRTSRSASTPSRSRRRSRRRRPPARR